MRELPALIEAVAAKRHEEPRMAKNAEARARRLDDAARAGWLYYVAGNTQDEIARKLGISRQTAQRLVSLAMSERLIKVRLDHPIARCMELAVGAAAALRPALLRGFADRSGLDLARRSASRRSRRRRWSAGCAAPDPVVIGIGTGRTMRAVADQLPAMQCPQHKLVALVGTGKVDGSASFYDVIIRVSDTVRAAHYPMPLPVIARSVEERDLLISLPRCAACCALVEQADVTFVGVGSIGENSALLKDGFITRRGERSAAPRRRGRRNHRLGVRRARPPDRRATSTSASPARRCASRPSA